MSDEIIDIIINSKIYRRKPAGAIIKNVNSSIFCAASRYDFLAKITRTVEKNQLHLTGYINLNIRFPT